MSALICGSFAYDNIMLFEGRFKEHILPDNIHILNVSFLVPQLRKDFGGCAGNIAYNLKLLGGSGSPMGTVGKDFIPYANWMDNQDVSRQYITEIPNAFTAQAYITTDLDDNQITAFHPGAMNESHQNKVPTNADISIGIVAPDGRQGMIEHAEQFATAGIPFVFDPGQGLPMFDGAACKQFIEQAEYVVVNDYEAQMLQEKTSLSASEIAQRVQAMIVTRGGEGSVIYTNNGSQIDIPVVEAKQLLDPTGCGDAFRAGLLYGLMNDMDWETTGRIASLIGSIKIMHSGTQNHSFSPEEFKQDFKTAFGREI